MSFFDAFRHRLKPLVQPGVFSRELHEEMRLHVALDAEQQRGTAAAGDEGYAAERRLGRAAYYAEETRRMTPLRWLDVLIQDLRYGTRTLRRAPLFSTVAVVSLALGIGANTAIFGLLYTVLLEPLPLPHPEQLVSLEVVAARGPGGSFPWDEFPALRDTPGAPPLVAVASVSNIAAEVNGEREFTGVQLVSGGFFPTLGLKPVVGRLLSPEDERSATPVVVISENVWDRRFNRDPAIVQRTVKLRDASFSIVGVAPREYYGLVFPGRFDMAVPISAATIMGERDFRGPRGGAVMIAGRLGNPASLAAASAALDAGFQRCCSTFTPGGGKSAAPGQPAGATGAPYLRLREISHGIPFGKVDPRGDYGRLLFILMGGVAVVLLIACANVGNLLLARAAARQRELAVRLSLGASRARLVRQLLTESLQLGIVGGTLGLLLAAWCSTLLSRQLPPGMEVLSDLARFRPRPVVFSFTGVVSLACVALFGLVPAIRATRRDLVTPLKNTGHSPGSRRAGLLDRGLVVAQVALALLLVTGATLLATTLRNLRQVDGGFASTHVLLANVETRGTPYERDGVVPLHSAILDRIRQLPGVRFAGMATITPVFGGRTTFNFIDVPGYEPAPREDMSSFLNAVTPGFLDAAGIRLIVGRDFSARDGAAAPTVAIVTKLSRESTSPDERSSAQRFGPAATTVSAIRSSASRETRGTAISELNRSR